MADLVLSPDAEAAVISHLASALTVPVSQSVQNPRPASFVTVRRTGGFRSDVVVDAAQLTVEAWAASPADAHDLCQLARGHCHAMVGTVVAGVAVSAVAEFAGPGYLPDPESRQPRYSMTLSMTCRTART